MTDELRALRRANPTTSEALEAAVAVDRQTLIEMLDADTAAAPRRLAADRFRSHQPNRSTTRAGYIGAMAVAAGLVIVALMGADEPVAEQDVVEPAADEKPVASVVVDDPDDESASVDEPPVEAAVQIAEVPETVTESDVNEGPPPTVIEEAVAAGDVVVTGEAAVSGDAALSDSGSGPESESEPVALPAGALFDPSIDVLSVHLDYFHRDDGHAAVAIRELATWFELEPHVVGGTADDEFDGYIHPFADVMDATWGDVWFDARSDRGRSLQATADRWLAAIDRGGQVWVAEGGVSDFTAEVLAELTNRRPDLDTRATVQVVQHSASNEQGTAVANLQYVTANTTYQRIDDGNLSNDSANLKQPSEAFQATALAGLHRESWAEAFDYLSADKLDFSDTVEVLHILGIDLATVADPDDFAAQFINSAE